jgi:hypothetical protein
MVSIIYLPYNVAHLTLVHFWYLGLIILNTTTLILNNIFRNFLIILIQRAMGYIYDIYRYNETNFSNDISLLFGFINHPNGF